MSINRNQMRKSRKNRIIHKVRGDKQSPRLCIFKSSMHIYAQAIDDINGVTLESASDAKIEKGTKCEKAILVGQKIAEKCLNKGIKTIKFDRNGLKYHGCVKALAEAARKQGLKF